MNITKTHIALITALLFHVCGFIGIVFSPYKNWFIQNTSFTLVLMAILLVWVQDQKNKFFWLFFLVCFIGGMCSEIIGVHTGLLFGQYHYGDVLGIQLFKVPVLIGINWFVIVFCSGSIMYQLQQWTLQKFDEAAMISTSFQKLSFVFDSAVLATFFDYIMEPVAVKLQFWYWKDGNIPVLNFVCWFLISGLLLLLFQHWSFNKKNPFAVHLIIIQLLFFIALRIYL
jgi:putative membrane protein